MSVHRSRFLPALFGSKIPPARQPARDTRQARLQECRAVWRPVPESRRAESGACRNTSSRRPLRILASTGCARTSRRPPRSPRISASSFSSFPPSPQEERTSTAEGWSKLGQELAGYQKKLAAMASDFAWHNHSFEFAKLPDGSYPLDHIFAAAPDLQWQADIGWIQWAGEDPGQPGSRNTPTGSALAAHQGPSAERRERR